jgi:hypothetical protein
MMARSKPGALDALRKLREQRDALDAKEAKLREKAAGELGKLLIECGAEALEPAKLRLLIRGTMMLGIDTALSRIAAA